MKEFLLDVVDVVIDWFSELWPILILFVAMVALFIWIFGYLKPASDAAEAEHLKQQQAACTAVGGQVVDKHNCFFADKNITIKL